MRNKKRILALMMAAVLLVGATIMGTMAYLTSTDEVTNTFTVGSIAITLDEAKVNENGDAITGEGAARVKENDYKLLPGKEYDKDPTVHVTAKSEPSWLFVKVENGLADIEAGTTIAQQIEANHWTALSDATGVYYKACANIEVAQDFVVFENFTIDGDIANAALAQYATAQIKITAYAVQKEGFSTADAAWEATFGE